VNKKYGGVEVYLQRWKEVRNQLAAPTTLLAGIESKSDSLIFQPVAYSIPNNRLFASFGVKLLED
jgi:hypothetical protein